MTATIKNPFMRKNPYERRYNNLFSGLTCYAIVLAMIGFLMDDPRNILPGLKTIACSSSILLTDYIALAGIGAAFVNAALVTAISLLVLYLSDDTMNGFSFVEIGLMSGFALFGKNFINIWPIMGGTWLYAKYKHEPFSKYSGFALTGCALAPMVSFLAVDGVVPNIFIAIGAGLLIGFVLPPFAGHTYKLQNGLNLYNVGFACGILGFILVSIMDAWGNTPQTVYYWSKENNYKFGILLIFLCSLLIIAGFKFTRRPAWAIWAGYLRLLRTAGRAPCDYLRMFEYGPVLVNIGVNGIFCTLFLLVLGCDLNGPTIGGIFTVLGYSAYGKHIRNISPVMLGVFLSSLTHSGFINGSSTQLAYLFGTSLAPISGYFGWIFGIIAGFLHGLLVLRTGYSALGLNLYNNGFSAGIIAIFLYPVITSIIRRRKPVVLDMGEFYDNFTMDQPVDLTSEKLSVEQSNLEAWDEEYEHRIV